MSPRAGVRQLSAEGLKFAGITCCKNKGIPSFRQPAADGQPDTTGRSRHKNRFGYAGQFPLLLRARRQSGAPLEAALTAAYLLLRPSRGATRGPGKVANSSSPRPICRAPVNRQQLLTCRLASSRHLDSPSASMCVPAKPCKKIAFLR